MSQRASLKHWAEYLAARGIAVYTIEYRTSTAGPSCPQAAHDVIAAVKFIAGDAAALGLAATRIGTLGASAGAHLTAHAAFAREEASFRGAYPADPNPTVMPTLRKMVLAYGVFDLAAHWHQTRAVAATEAEDVTLRFMGAALDATPERFAVASPINYLTPARAAPKLLLTWGVDDGVVSPQQTLAFAAALDSAGFDVERHPVAGAGHHWFSQHPIDDPRGFTAGVAPAIGDFLAKQLCA